MVSKVVQKARVEVWEMGSKGMYLRGTVEEDEERKVNHLEIIGILAEAGVAQ